ncbi:hypothetical protein LWI29_010671 [Acer saccharum]|uniref:Uncharacterized protein n=1 Tax=Acer saccharum TaxID=4024 RepID=A0AA39VV42_ACESA|nr:hypothetical protein LWI29_010671 [Acer saccharum]
MSCKQHTGEYCKVNITSHVFIEDGKEFDQYGDDQLWKILDDYFLCFEGNAKESEEVAPFNTNVDQPSFETDDEEELEELLMAVDQPSFETDDEKELEELLMADHNEPHEE